MYARARTCVSVCARAHPPAYVCMRMRACARVSVSVCPRVYMDGATHTVSHENVEKRRLVAGGSIVYEITRAQFDREAEFSSMFACAIMSFVTALALRRISCARHSNRTCRCGCTGWGWDATAGGAHFLHSQEAQTSPSSSTSPPSLSPTIVTNGSAVVMMVR